MRARLVALDGRPSIELTKELILFGRDEDCDVRLDHKSVSKLHCVIIITDGVLLLRDLGSTNGTRVNGQRVRRAALLPNDIIAIANMKYTVKFGNELEKDAAGDNAADRKDAKPPAAPYRINALPDIYPEQKTPKG